MILPPACRIDHPGWASCVVDLECCEIGMSNLDASFAMQADTSSGCHQTQEGVAIYGVFLDSGLFADHAKLGGEDILQFWSKSSTAYEDNLVVEIGPIDVTSSGQSVRSWHSPAMTATSTAEALKSISKASFCLAASRMSTPGHSRA